MRDRKQRCSGLTPLQEIIPQYRIQVRASCQCGAEKRRDARIVREVQNNASQNLTAAA